MHLKQLFRWTLRGVFELIQTSRSRGIYVRLSIDYSRTVDLLMLFQLLFGQRSLENRLHLQCPHVVKPCYMYKGSKLAMNYEQ